MNRFVNSLKAFHLEEDGLNTVESILLVAVAGILMIGLVSWAKPSLFDLVAEKIREVIGTVARLT